MDDDRPRAGPLSPADSLAAPVPGGIRLHVRLTPRASTDRIDAVKRDAAGRPYLMARVRAVAEKGRANGALVALLSSRLGLPASSISIAAGHTSRLKTILLAGDQAELSSRIEGLVGGDA